MTMDMHNDETRTLVRGADGSLYLVGTGKSAVRRIPDGVATSGYNVTIGTARSAVADSNPASMPTAP